MSGKSCVLLNQQTGENGHLCDVLNKVLAERESAAYEPHRNYVMGQRDNILVESRRLDKRKRSESTREHLLLSYRYLLGRVGIRERDGKHADVLLGYKVGIQVRQAHQSYSHNGQKHTGIKHIFISDQLTRYNKTGKQKKEVRCSLDRNSSMGDAMATVAEMWVSLTIRDGRSLIMMSGISTVHIVRATTHCLAQR